MKKMKKIALYSLIRTLIIGQSLCLGYFLSTAHALDLLPSLGTNFGHSRSASDNHLQAIIHIKKDKILEKQSKFIRQLDKTKWAMKDTGDSLELVLANPHMGDLTEIEKEFQDLQAQISFQVKGNQLKLIQVLLLPHHQQMLHQSPFMANAVLKKVLSPQYRPSPQEFFLDIIYRNPLEQIIGKEHLAELKSAQELDLVAKTHQHEIIDILKKDTQSNLVNYALSMAPERMSLSLPQELLKENILPQKKFHLDYWRNSSNWGEALTQARGLISAVKTYGLFEHDELMSQLSGVPQTEMIKLRNQAKMKGDDVHIVRVQLEDVENTRPEKLEEIYELGEYFPQAMPYYRDDSTVIFLGNSVQGKYPIPVTGNSVVFQRKSFQNNNIVGKYNPGLVNPHLVGVMNNKYFEARLWNKYVPGAFPGTQLLREVVSPQLLLHPEDRPTLKQVEDFMNAIRVKFPQGFVIKGSYDSGTEELGLITDTVPVLEHYQEYLESDFENEFYDRAQIL